MTQDRSDREAPSRSRSPRIGAELLERFGARTLRLPSGGTVFEQGEAASRAFLVASGQIRMVVTSERGREFTQGYFLPGQTFGEPPLLTGGIYPAAARAVVASSVLHLPRESFLRLLRENPEEHLELTRVLAERLLYKSMMLGELATAEAEHRLAALLGHFRRSQGAPVDHPWRVPFTRQQLADMTGLRVETVIRTIKSMEEKGRLRIQAGRVLWNPAHEPDLLDE